MLRLSLQILGRKTTAAQRAALQQPWRSSHLAAPLGTSAIRAASRASDGTRLALNMAGIGLLGCTAAPFALADDRKQEPGHDVTQRQMQMMHPSLIDVMLKTLDITRVSVTRDHVTVVLKKSRSSWDCNTALENLQLRTQLNFVEETMLKLCVTFLTVSEFTMDNHGTQVVFNMSASAAESVPPAALKQIKECIDCLTEEAPKRRTLLELIDETSRVRNAVSDPKESITQKAVLKLLRQLNFTLNNSTFNWLTRSQAVTELLDADILPTLAVLAIAGVPEWRLEVMQLISFIAECPLGYEALQEDAHWCALRKD